MKVMDLRLDPWKWQGVVMVGGTPTEAKSWLRKTFKIDANIGSGSCGHAYVEYGRPWCLWLESLRDIPALAHEAFHVAAGVLDTRGLKHHADSEEAYTYTMEFIIRAVLNEKHWKKV